MKRQKTTIESRHTAVYPQIHRVRQRHIPSDILTQIKTERRTRKR